MANIYEQKSDYLHELLEKSRDENGATVVIPELQRPYVWTPNQVTLLVDSLIRGWPFGTLLMWKVNHDELHVIPHRTFWLTVDRTSDDDGSATMRKNPPATYQMVLDGQQRLQSLILALAGDDSGFKLEDKEWSEVLHSRRARGRQPKHQHWSKASLCLDLEKFKQEYDQSGGLSSMDFCSSLVWAVTDPIAGRSAYPKPDNYLEPLRTCSAQGNKSLVRLSRLWNAAQPNQNLKEQHFREISKEILQEHQIEQQKIDVLLQPLGEFMTTVRDVKLAKVTYLELLPFDPLLWSREEYNDSIVSIFTRLNTAGRTLTREEITFAWLKSNWNPELTNGKSAADCFEELKTELKKRDLEIAMDELINAVSFIWSIRFNQGKLLANSDLLKGEIIRPMALALSRSWSIISESVLAVTDLVQNLGITFGVSGQYASVNALAFLWAWMTVARLWVPQHQLSVPQIDNFDKKVKDTLIQLVDRWLFCSTWAGKWAESSNTAMTALARDLHEAWGEIEAISNVDRAHEKLELLLRNNVKNLETDAVNYVSTSTAQGRERVSTYKNMLWVWHRLDATRWRYSSIPLRSNKKKAVLEVDHTLSFAYWEKRLRGTGGDDIQDMLSLCNLLGNCSLLEKTFNISKSDQSLKSFIAQVHEFKEKKENIDEWAASLLVPQELLDPESATIEKIAEALRSRDVAMRAELSDFVKGTKVRTDV